MDIGKDLTKRQAEIFEFIKKYSAKYGYPPTVRDIGKAVGLSEAAVRQRVQKLIDTGVMQIVAVTDPMQLGRARQAMIGVHVSGDIELVAEQLAKIDEVDYIVITAGSYDLIAEVVVRDDAHLLSLLNDRIRPLEGVVRTESFVYLKLVKQTYNWGAR